MMKIDIVRAWKDAAYRAGLSAEEQELLPENPAGELELSDAELAAIYGGSKSEATLLNSVLCNSVLCNSVALC